MWYLLEETNRASLFLFLSSKIKTIAKQLSKILKCSETYFILQTTLWNRWNCVCLYTYIVLMRKLKTTSAASTSQHSWDTSLSVYKILSHVGKSVLVCLLLIFSSYYWVYHMVLNTHFFSEQLKWFVQERREESKLTSTEHIICIKLLPFELFTFYLPTVQERNRYS